MNSALVGTLLLANFLLRLDGLGHASIKPLDEVFHAIVARHLSTHPLQPTLNVNDYLPVPAEDWQNASVWLHKPPAALWLIALSFRTFGVSAFTLRLPSALLATLACGLTYLIGRRLLSPRSALIALVLQAFNPVMEMLVHGYVFSDHVDVSLLFWCELSIWLVLLAHETHSRRTALLCGVAQGAAFLSKTFPGLLPTPLMLILLVRPIRTGDHRRQAMANFGWMIFATLLVAGPWNGYVWIRWPHEYVAQTLGILSHLNRDVEGWAGPWDRVVADYGWRVFGLLYPAIIAAVGLVFGHAARRHNAKLVFIAAWIVIAFLPNLLATSKPMTATLVGWPALLLSLAWMMDQALSGSPAAAVAWLIASAAPLVIGLGEMPIEGWGYPPNYHFGAIAILYWRPIVFGLLALASATLARFVRIPARTCSTIAAIATLLLLILPIGAARGHGYAMDFWRVSQIRGAAPPNPALIAFASGLPVRSTLLVEEQSKLENKIIAFAADHDCYPLNNLQWQSMANTITTRGGLAYVVSSAPLDLPVVWRDPTERRFVYAASPEAAAAVEAH